MNECTECGCYYADHMHVFYKTEPEFITVIDVGVKGNLDREGDRLKAIEEFVAKAKKLIAQFENEKKKIMEASAAFAHFLEKNAIVAYNDTFEAYMEMMIENETIIRSSTGKPGPSLSSYRTMLSNYREEKKIFEHAREGLDKIRRSVDAKDIPEMVNSLFKMPQFGENLKNCYDQCIAGQEKETAQMSTNTMTIPLRKIPRSNQSQKAPNPDKHDKGLLQNTKVRGSSWSEIFKSFKPFS